MLEKGSVECAAAKSAPGTGHHADLGAVNMAALEDCSQPQTQGFLDARRRPQHGAGNAGGAIRRIDARRARCCADLRTRKRPFRQMFPSLFGGGGARLLMTGENPMRVWQV